MRSNFRTHNLSCSFFILFHIAHESHMTPPPLHLTFNLGGCREENRKMNECVNLFSTEAHIDVVR